MKKLLITGGHVTPALAVIDELQTLYPDISIVFVGRKYINTRETTQSFEFNEVTRREIPFIHLEAGRLTRLASWRSIGNIFQIPTGLVRAFEVLSKEKPSAILTFGGYIGFPVALAAFIKGIPVYVHEQTIHPGIANRMISAVSKIVFISFDETKKYFRGSHVVYTGNPLRKAIFSQGKKLFEAKNKPCIYVTGGSMGAHSVNTHIERILPELLKDFIVIHQIGNVQEFHDYARLTQLKKTLPLDLSSRYYPMEHIMDDQIGWVYSVADFVIGRSGANTFFELIALQKPAIFIPLPWSAHDEQRTQAHLFKTHGAGEVFEQNRQSIELLQLIYKMNDNLTEYKEGFTSLTTQFKTDATRTIIKNIFET